jgi:hypothetical protein
MAHLRLPHLTYCSIQYTLYSCAKEPLAPQPPKLAFRLSGRVLLKRERHGLRAACFALPVKQIVKFAPWMIDRTHLELPAVRKEIRRVHVGRRLGAAVNKDQTGLFSDS